MSDQLFSERNFDLFVSYSLNDVAKVEPIVGWLKRAGLKVWWAKEQLLPGAPMASALPAGLSDARSALFFVSETWVGSTWCEDEYNAALQQRRKDRRYRMIGVHIDQCKVPDFLANSRFLDLSTFKASTAAILLRALADPPRWFHGKRDVYLSRSWREGESDEPDSVCKTLSSEYGFRVIGDAFDQDTYDPKTRVQRIIASCGALVAVFPYREDAHQHGNTSEFMPSEVSIAAKLGRPFLLLAASSSVKLEPALTAGAIGGKAFQLQAENGEKAWKQALLDLKDAFRPSPRMAYSFFTTSLTEEADGLNDTVELIQSVTCMECLVGQNLEGQHAQADVVDRITNAEFVLADITDDRPNSLIEAGIARGAGIPLHLICKAPDSGSLRIPFMLRDKEPRRYKDSIERLAVIHAIARGYRRHVYY